MVRHALRLLLESELAIVIVGEAATGRQAVELTRDLQPEVVLMDVRIPEMDGIDATRIIHADALAVCVIGLSMFTHAQQGEAMPDAGAKEGGKTND